MSKTMIVLAVVLVSALLVTAVCRRLRLPAPLVLVLIGLGVSLLPGVPEVGLDPELIFPLVLAPLLYSSAVQTSARELRRSIRPIALLAIGLVLFTAFAVGVVAWAVLPGFPLISALILGAVVAPPDAIATASIGRRLRLHRRVMTVLDGESLLNDATALTLVRVLVAAAVAGATTPGVGGSVLAFLVTSVGGVVVGVAAGWAVRQADRRSGDPAVASALRLVVPFAVYLLAEEVLSVSGVLAVVVTGLYLGRRAGADGAGPRPADAATWAGLETALEAFVFALIGLQLAVVVRGLHAPVATMLLASVAVVAAAILARAVWVFPMAWLARRAPRVCGRPDVLPWQAPLVISWAGVRGVVTLAAAYAVPEAVPGRDSIVFLAFVVTVVTLLLHGSTLPPLIRRLGISELVPDPLRTRPDPGPADLDRPGVDGSLRSV